MKVRIIMMKYFAFYSLFIVIVFSCKKKTSEASIEPEVTQPAVEAKYTCVLSNQLNLTENLSGGFDSTIGWHGYYYKTLNNQITNGNYDSIICNNYPNYFAIPTNLNYYDFSKNTTWRTKSNEIGNINYIETSNLPSLSNQLSVTSNTFNASVGIPVKFLGLTNTDYITVSYVCDICTIGGDMKSYSVALNISNMSDTITEISNFGVPINANGLLSITLKKDHKVIINNNDTYFRREVTYSYNIKRVL